MTNEVPQAPTMDSTTRDAVNATANAMMGAATITTALHPFIAVPKNIQA